MTAWICARARCSTPTPRSPRRVPDLRGRAGVRRHPDGQRWTHMAELGRTTHRRPSRGAGPDRYRRHPRVRDRPARPAGPDPGGQRAVGLHPAARRAPPGAIDELGGLPAICLSHPHFYAAHLEFAEAFDAPVFLIRGPTSGGSRAARRASSCSTTGRAGAGRDGRPHRRPLRRRRRAALAGRVGRPRRAADRRHIMVVEDRGWVSFMWSFPNLIPSGPGHGRRRRPPGRNASGSTGCTAAGGGTSCSTTERRRCGAPPDRYSPGYGRAALTIGATCPIGNSTVSVRSSCADLRREQNRR